jgi:hypothetical protein
MNTTRSPRPRLAVAARAVEEARAEWERYQCEPATAEDIADAQEREAAVRAELASLTDGLATLPTRGRLALLRLIRATQQFFGLEGRHAWATGFLLGVPAVVAVSPVVLLARPAGLTGAAIFVGAYFAAVGVVSLLLLTTGRAGLDGTIERLRKQRAANAARAADLAPQLAALAERVEFLRGAQAAHVAYEQAVEHHRGLGELLASERYQLADTDWRSLRGVAFEEFVARVFRSLGYDVRETRAVTGHGVDLIARGHGRTVAVHTTGCADAVGNRAVQEVFAGRVYHKCEECAVVTNSRFTSGAIDLAAEVKCELIDAARIPALIAGGVF